MAYKGGVRPKGIFFSGFSGLVIYWYLKDGAFTALKRDTAVYVNNGRTKEVLFLSKRGGAFPFKMLQSTPLPRARLLSIMLMIVIVT